ncbi:MAG: RIP metalloprotease RseP [Undibacterium sp.]|nr:RIP metalloprotease RseP [Undibacterium sp.]
MTSLLQLLQTIVVTIIGLGGLIIFHELGHYAVARFCGVRVLRFSVGMGKVVWMRRFGKSETEWTLSAIPLGGYVKFYDSRDADLSLGYDKAGDFSAKPVWQKMAIIAAGPFANFLLAALLFTTVFVHGTPDPVAKLRIASNTTSAYQAGLRQADEVVSVNHEEVKSWSEMRWKLLQSGLDKRDAQLQLIRKSAESNRLMEHLVVTLPLSRLSSAELEADFLQAMGISYFLPPAMLKEVLANGVAQRAGLSAGDRIIAINNHPVVDSLALVEIIRASPNRPLNFLVQGPQHAFELAITPESKTENGKTVGMIGVLPNAELETREISYPLTEALAKGLQKTWDSSAFTLKMLGKMLTGELSLRNITGPITIADYAGKTARIGLISYLGFIAMISISLGVMNLLPIPVLDGGHLLYYSLEVLSGRKIPEKYVEMAQRGGLTVLLCLMLVALFNDVLRQLP